MKPEQIKKLLANKKIHYAEISRQIRAGNGSKAVNETSIGAVVNKQLFDPEIRMAITKLIRKGDPERAYKGHWGAEYRVDALRYNDKGHRAVKGMEPYEIKDKLKELGLNQTDLAKAIEIDPCVVSSVIIRVRHSPDVMQKIADKLNIPYSKLWGKDE
jgi:hypothetical protein